MKRLRIGLSLSTAMLLYLALFELHVLARNGIILPDNHLFRHRPGILFGDIKEACASGAVEANFNCGWLGHRPILQRQIDRPEGASAIEGRNLLIRLTVSRHWAGIPANFVTLTFQDAQSAGQCKRS